MVPPHDLDAEAAVISAVLVGPDAYAEAASLLAPQDFYSESHRRIWESVEGLSRDGKAVDVVTVLTHLRDNGRLAQTGGMAYLTEVVNAAPAIANVATYAASVAAKARVREVMRECQRLLAEGYAGPPDAEDWISTAAMALSRVASKQAGGATAENVKDVLARVIQSYSAAKGGHLTGIPTGLRLLDRETGGLQEGEVTVIAAVPGCGKTGLAAHMAMAGAGAGHCAAMFSLEMPSEQIVGRALCGLANVDMRRARTGMLTPTDWSRLTEASIKLAGFGDSFQLYERSCSLAQVRAKCLQIDSALKRTGKRLRLVVVDYLQLMTGDAKASREELVSANARGLKMLAKELSVSVIALSQLNRTIASRQNKRPMMSDCRESGAIEEGADSVIGLYRDEIYNQDTTANGIVELLFLKARHGQLGTIEVGFHGPTVTFRDLDDGPSETNDWRSP